MCARIDAGKVEAVLQNGGAVSTTPVAPDRKFIHHVRQGWPDLFLFQEYRKVARRLKPDEIRPSNWKMASARQPFVDDFDLDQGGRPVITHSANNRLLRRLRFLLRGLVMSTVRLPVLAVCAALLCATSGAGLAQPGNAPAQIASCEACHGQGGNSQKSDVPRLNGQESAYLVTRLREFLDPTRGTPIR